MARRRMSDVEAAVAAEREEARLLAKLQPSTISSEQGRQYVRCFASMAPKIGRGAAHSSCLAAAMDEPARYAVMSERGRVVAHSGTLEGAHRASRRARHVGSSVNRADGGEPAPYQVILQQLGGQGRLRAMLGASFSQADGGRTLEMKFPNRLRSRPNFIRIRYEPGPDTYVVEFWRVDRFGPGKKLRELDDVYADSLKEIIERETGLYLNLTGVTSTYVPRGTVAGRRARIMGGFEGDLARAEIAKLQGYETGASGEPIDQEIARLRAAVQATR